MFASTNPYLPAARVGCLWRVAWSVVVLSLAGAAGCAAPKKQPPVAREVVRLSDLGVTGAETDPNTYNCLETQPTIGRFPVGISVGRVMLEDPKTDGPPYLVIDKLSDPGAVYWGELFDSIQTIREVLPVDPQSCPLHQVTIPQLLTASRRLKCRLCVIYAENDVADNASQVVGALYDADTNELVGVIFAEEVVDPTEKREAPTSAPAGDERHQDAHWLAARKFEGLVRSLVWELINRDREPGAAPETTTQPAPPGPAPVQSSK